MEGLSYQKCRCIVRYSAGVVPNTELSPYFLRITCRKPVCGGNLTTEGCIEPIGELAVASFRMFNM